MQAPGDRLLELPGRQGRLVGDLDRARVYGVYPDTDGALAPLGGGTTTVVYNLKTGRTERQHLSLGGTAVNCAGGVTPWGSWLTCEETVVKAGQGVKKDHGWVFEVPSRAPGLVEPVPLTGLGRFKHEAATCVLNKDGRVVVYTGDDEANEYVYRFVSAGRVNPRDRKANMTLLDEGTLSVARFDADGTVSWLPRRW